MTNTIVMCFVCCPLYRAANCGRTKIGVFILVILMVIDEVTCRDGAWDYGCVSVEEIVMVLIVLPLKMLIYMIGVVFPCSG